MQKRRSCLVPVLLGVLAMVGTAKSASFQVTCVQYPISRSVDTNIAAVADYTALAKAAGSRVVVFPEGNVTGYYLDDLKNLKQPDLEAILARCQSIADSQDVYLIVGMPWYVDSVLYNSAFVLGPDGSIVENYGKSFVVMGKVFTNRDNRAFFEIDGVPCTLYICHDQRYPELARIPVLAGAMVQFYISWESAQETKRDNYRCQMIARARENQIYAVCCNAPANTEEGGSHGESRIISPDGTILAEAGLEEPVMIHAVINPAMVRRDYIEEARSVSLFHQWWEDSLDTLQSGTVSEEVSSFQITGALDPFKVAICQFNVSRDRAANLSTMLDKMDEMARTRKPTAAMRCMILAFPCR